MNKLKNLIQQKNTKKDFKTVVNVIYVMNCVLQKIIN